MWCGFCGWGEEVSFRYSYYTTYHSIQVNMLICIILLCKIRTNKYQFSLRILNTQKYTFLIFFT